MLLTIASILAFLSVSTIVYLGLTAYLPIVKSRIDADILDVDQTLKKIFYTDYDARLFIGLKYGGAIAALLVGQFLFESLIFGLFMAAVVFWIPSLLLEKIVRNRQDLLNEQTADVMTALSASIKSGMTLNEAIDDIATNMRPPIAQEFALIKERIDSGQTIVTALQAADNRLQAPRLSLIFQSIIVSQERGGRLAVLMDRLSEATREISRVEERVKTETAGLLLSARIMVFMPFIICLFLYAADPNQVTMLFTTAIGNVILVIAIALDIGAFRIMQKLIDLDV